MHPLLLSLALVVADESVFSGPQPGEKLKPFKAVRMFGQDNAKEEQLPTDADKPTLLIFVHEITRPSAALVRALSSYADSRKADGLKTQIVWLSRDRAETTKWLTRAKDSLGLKTPVFVSVDGIEGPGAYGLNRKVNMTILVAKEGKVTSNFALIEPAVKDSVAVVESVCKVVGGKAPDLKALEALAYPGRKDDRDPELVGLLRKVITKDATPEDVAKAAEEVEKCVGDDRAKKKQLGEIAVIASEKGYGTEAAQKQLKKWAEKYGQKKQ